ncbi:outer spore coat protein CotM [Bacillus halotolerans]|uniref:Hsp20/alpha crystallin family protein n=1 Tax=Bacillus halotolerans TaxID=260554 RepID=A0A9Q4EM58_9BACI|nr:MULTISPECIES: outer spore coat protein CotM [Bacillus]MBV7320443.1 Hsp20/alpha crystallin family protein [Halalkalibacterium halodurans]AZV47569.1 Hsp20/alpha crystallin family protein [Bacillus halotolerans]MBU5246007.1 Hsp20/alpha crystallin family protein [Bacillus halotolerans]MCP9299881.1 Hsp20/alpha crystallin family protein [Bacillus halotolerans]MCV0024377.1 Hsp20/alpha crystallin family protein [Bacillus sp. XT-2]
MWRNASMTHSKRNDANDFDGMEEWLRQFFEDPFAWYDETLPIDLYETSQQYIIEADLSAIQPTQITITLSGCEFILTVKSSEQTLEKQMMLPFYLNDKSIETECENQILTVAVNKETNDGSSFSLQFPLS